MAGSGALPLLAAALPRATEAFATAALAIFASTAADPRCRGAVAAAVPALVSSASEVFTSFFFASSSTFVF